jgi:peptide/nickel transport system ATP-binding protein
MIFQDPHAALNPSMDVFTAVEHPLVIHRLVQGRAARERRVYEMLERVGLAPASRVARKLPRELSGGQRQRVVIARALIVEPELVIADEPVSMLDMSVRAKTLELMLSLKKELGLTFVYITHDLATARFFCDRVAVMYLGRIVEEADTAELFRQPRHPYTRALLDAVAETDAIGRRRVVVPGEVADAAAIPGGCPFHPRCPTAFDICGWEPRDMRAALERRWTGVDYESYAHERDALANLDRLDGSARPARIEVAAGHTVAEVEAVLSSVLEQPDERISHGVEHVVPVDGAVELHFREPLIPRVIDADAARVACHLYDPQAMARSSERPVAQP